MQLIRVRRATMAIAGITIVVPAHAGSARAAPRARVVRASADATVRGRQALGTRNTLEVSASTRALLRFVVPSRPRGAHVTLVLRQVGGASPRIAARLVSRRWTERRVTAGSAPQLSARSASGSARLGHDVRLDVTELVAHRGVVSLGVTATRRQTMVVASRERGAATAPRLIVAPVGAVSAPRGRLALTTPAAGTSAAAVPVYRGRANAGESDGPVTVTIYRGRGISGRPASVGIPATPAPGGGWIARHVMPRGTWTVVASQEHLGGIARSNPATFKVTADPEIASAGDISCDPDEPGDIDAPDERREDPSAEICRQRQTSDLVAGDPSLSAVIPLGDLQYRDGLSYKYFSPNAYDQTWGRVKDITYPVIGHHEFSAQNNIARGYFDYFDGDALTGPAGTRTLPGDLGGYYSTEIGAWHLVVLNSICADFPAPFDCRSNPQYRWLQHDLAGQPRGKCILIAFHEMRFSSSDIAPVTTLDPIWRLMQAAHVAISLNAHAHIYERFAPQDADGTADPAGVQQFVVGTGGVGHGGGRLHALAPNEVTRQFTTYGVLRLRLHAHSYDWRFEGIPGDAPYTDTGSRSCPR